VPGQAGDAQDPGSDRAAAIRGAQTWLLPAADGKGSPFASFERVRSDRLAMRPGIPTARLIDGSQQVGKTKDVRAAVQSELGFDPLINAAQISVSNIWFLTIVT
jgi:hypothetical protein